MNPEQVFSKEAVYVHIYSQIYKDFLNEAQSMLLQWLHAHIL